jgi:hypothetical protein
MSTRVVERRAPARADEPRVSTHVVEPFISLPLGLFSYTKRFCLQMDNFVTSRELSRERGVKIDASKTRRSMRQDGAHTMSVHGAGERI